MHEALKLSVCQTNIGLVAAGLITLTWGNASGIDRAANVVAIKPSGVPYATLKPQDIVLISLTTGQRLEGAANPSSDTPTHLELYRAFPHIGGIVHTHSFYATCFAQAQVELPCLGTTHADHFCGTIPVTRQLTPEEIATHYEINTGKVIVETFHTKNISPDAIPGILVASHAPFAWGPSPEKALENALVLESIANLQFHTHQLRPNTPPIPDALLHKHHKRKHGPTAYYGQK